MSVFNDDNNELKHPAFHDEQIKKKKMWAKILDVLFSVFMVLGFVAWVLFCIWMCYFRERM